jgi:hypothetical protein
MINSEGRYSRRVEGKKKCEWKVFLFKSQRRSVSDGLIGLHHPPDGVTNPKYKL